MRAASVSWIVWLASGEVVKLLVAVKVLPWTAVCYPMDGRLENFGCWTTLPLWILPENGGATIVPTAHTEGFQTIRPAFTDPAAALEPEQK